MRDLSLHLMDLANNSITAGATSIDIRITIRPDKWLTMTITDDGCGMDAQTAQRALGPFGTSRTTRKVGLGLPLTQANARLTGGDLVIRSSPGEGTTVTATFDTSHIDCLPLGDLAQTMAALIAANPQRPAFTLTLASPLGEEVLSTREMQEALGEVPLDDPAVIEWILQSLREQADTVFGGER